MGCSGTLDEALTVAILLVWSSISFLSFLFPDVCLFILSWHLYRASPGSNGWLGS